MALGEPGNQKQALGMSKTCIICLVLYPLTKLPLLRGQSFEIYKKTDQREIGDPSATCLVSHQQINLYKGMRAGGTDQLSAYMVMRAQGTQR